MAVIPAGRSASSAETCADLPAYLRDTYTWAYLNPRTLALLDRPWVVSAILFGNYKRLQKALLQEIELGMNVLQAACVYGDFSVNLAKRVGSRGRLDVIDVADVQVANCTRKLKDYPQVHTRVADAATPQAAVYDATSCFFLLHELPDDYKRPVVDALLGSVRRGGRVIFVDYHRPHATHPLRLLVSAVFDWLEPYAKTLWRCEIRDLATQTEEFEWQKRVYFGGLYQKVVAHRRAGLETS